MPPVKMVTSSSVTTTDPANTALVSTGSLVTHSGPKVLSVWEKRKKKKVHRSHYQIYFAIIVKVVTY